MKVYCVYQDENTYQMVFKPTPTSEWMNITFGRDVDAETSKDTWRILLLSKCRIEIPVSHPNRNLHATAYSLTGAWEYAFYINGAWCGTTHGYETNTSLDIKIDDEVPSLPVGTAIGGDSIVITTTSNLFYHVTGLKIAEITNVYTFTVNGVELETSIKWTDPVLISTMYWPMFPVKRNVDKSSLGLLDGETEYQDMSVAGFTELHKDVAGGVTWNNSNGFRARVEVLNPSEALNDYLNNGSAKTYFSNSSNPAYNKLYFTRIFGTGVTPETDEIWNCHSLFTFEYPV